jgi:hypothetical protein
MVRELQRILEGEMLRSWAKDEVYSISMRVCFKSNCPSLSIWRKVEEGSEDFSEPELDEMEKAIRYCRAGLLNGLLPLGVEWYIGFLPIEELRSLRIIGYFSVRLGSDKLNDLVHAYQAGRLPAGLSEFSESLRDFPKELQPEDMKGKLILVGKSIGPPYILMEGFKRSVSIMSSMQKGGPKERKIPVILGTCQRIRKWNHCPAGF